VDSEKKRSDEYWMGVRDALRMVDSFTKWARRNESRAKHLDDFIHDGLIAAAKRCESCLKDDLGLTFAEDEERIDESTNVEHIPSGYEIDSSSRDYSEVEEPIEPTFEVTPEDMSPGVSEVPIESESDSISIDNVGRLEEEEMDDISIDGPSREFTSDFELVEPTDLVVEQPDAAPEVEETYESEPETEKEEPSDIEHKASFTWADYEKAVSPDMEGTEPIEEDEDIELPPPIEFKSVETPVRFDESESTSVTTEMPEPPSSPSDGLEPVSETMEISEPPSIPTDEFESLPIDEEVSEATEEPEPITKPPPPPPPPESDEDEDERRRRARRLFFGD